MSRSDRVAELIKAIISEILQRDINDPRIKFASVTDVKIGEDLQLAQIFISILGDKETKQAAMQGIASAKKHIRYLLGQKLELRSTPEIMFREDDSIERGSRIFEIIGKLEKERVSVKPGKRVKAKK